MKNPMPRAGAAWPCFLLLVAGCTSPMPWERDWGKSTSLSGFFGQEASSVSGLPSPPSATLQGQTATPSGARAANPLVAATQSVTAAFKSAGEKVSSALDVKPKVIPATDPAKLSSRPEHLSPGLYLQAAQWSESHGAAAAARQQYEKALELDPHDVNALIAFARFHDRQGNGDEALRLYQQAQALAPTNTTVSNDLGLFHARRGNLDASLDALQQAVRLDPHNVRYRNNLAATLIASHRVPEAIAVLREVHPEATALFNAACLLSLNHETQQATSLLEESLRIDPSLAAAQEELRAIRGLNAPLAPSAVPPGSAPGTPDSHVARTGFRTWESTTGRDRSSGLPISSPSPRKLPPIE